jgi:hypothetical protein
MIKFKVALGHDLRGLSYHRSLKIALREAKIARKRTHKNYIVFHWNVPTKFYEGAWRPSE